MSVQYVKPISHTCVVSANKIYWIIYYFPHGLEMPLIFTCRATLCINMCFNFCPLDSSPFIFPVRPNLKNKYTYNQQLFYNCNINEDIYKELLKVGVQREWLGMVHICYVFTSVTSSNRRKQKFIFFHLLSHSLFYLPLSIGECLTFADVPQVFTSQEGKNPRNRGCYSKGPREQVFQKSQIKTYLPGHKLSHPLQK